MRVFLAVLVLIFSLQSWTKADDIREFQIEGMSIGDSLLDYFSEKEIKNNIQNYYKDNEYLGAVFTSSNDRYRYIQIHFKTNDKKFTIYAIDGIFYPESVKDCIKKRDEISKSMSAVFSNLAKEVRNDWNMSSGHGKLHGVLFKFNSGDFAEVVCYEYNKDHDEKDHGRVAVVTKELNDWIVNKAFK